MARRERRHALNRRSILRGGVAALAALSACAPMQARAMSPGLKLSGRYVQGGFAMIRTAPRAQVLLDGEVMGQATDQGLFLVGFDRDAPDTAQILVRTEEGEARHTLAIAKGDFDIQRIDGLPPDTVTPSSPALLARIAREVQRKNVGFASRTDADDFRAGFILPLKSFRLSGRFGGQRILNGEPRRPHYGDDMAAPEGTPVVAPAPGLVSFAEQGLHFEGGLIMIDHGQGLISLYLHLSQVAVRAGDRVAQGQMIGAVGKEGRATGPHLCWRLKWRGRNLDPMLLVGAQAPLA